MTTSQLPLSVYRLSYTAGNRQVLSDISFTLQPGELVGVIGPNGAGKSTLMKALIGFHKPQQGEITSFGHLVRELSTLEQARYISYMAQHTQVSFGFSVRQTIAMGAHAHQIGQQRSDRELQYQVETLLNELKLEHLLERRLTELSGGEGQLVQFARLLMQQAPVMLLDEPTSSLDIGHEAQLMNHLRAQCAQGASALVAIHNLNTAAAFCDRLLLLDSGRLLRSGPPSEVLEQKSLETLYRHPLHVAKHPETGTAQILPARTC